MTILCHGCGHILLSVQTPDPANRFLNCPNCGSTHEFVFSSEAVERWLNGSSRRGLQRYLEGRGFAVYDHEPEGELREAARLDLETEGVI